IQRRPDTAAAWVAAARLAEKYRMQRDTVMTRAHAERVIRLWSASGLDAALEDLAVYPLVKVDILNHLGYAHMSAKNFHESYLCFDLAARQTPYSGAPSELAEYYRAEMLWQSGAREYETALTGFQQFLDKYPESRYAGG